MDDFRLLPSIINPVLESIFKTLPVVKFASDKLMLISFVKFVSVKLGLNPVDVIVKIGRQS